MSEDNRNGATTMLEHLERLAARSLTVGEQMMAIAATHERLIEAWIAETGFAPSESVLVEQRNADGSITVFVRKKSASDSHEVQPLNDGDATKLERLERRVLVLEQYIHAMHAGAECPDDEANGIVRCNCSPEAKQQYLLPSLRRSR